MNTLGKFIRKNIKKYNLNCKNISPPSEIKY